MRDLQAQWTWHRRLEVSGKPGAWVPAAARDPASTLAYGCWQAPGPACSAASAAGLGSSRIGARRAAEYSVAEYTTAGLELKSTCQ